MKVWEFRKEDGQRVQALIRALYDHQSTLGNFPPLKPHGEKIWLDQIIPLLGNYAMIFCGGKEFTEGFITVRVKTYPSYLEQTPRASVGECFVKKELRGLGLGKTLFEAVENWCKEKGLSEIELQTTAGNTGAESFWSHLGFQKELSQWKRIL